MSKQMFHGFAIYISFVNANLIIHRDFLAVRTDPNNLPSLKNFVWISVGNSRISLSYYSFQRD